MQKCQYLEDLGLKTEQYGTNFITDKKRKKVWAEQRKKYGFDSRECWNLDRTFLEWIYTRVMMYKETARINLSYHTIPYKDSEITQEEAINKILSLAKEVLLTPEKQYATYNSISYKNLREICEIWKEVFPYMWW